MKLTKEDGMILAGKLAESEASARLVAEATDRRDQAAAALARLRERRAAIQAEFTAPFEPTSDERLKRLLSGEMPASLDVKEVDRREARNRRLTAEQLQIEADAEAVSTELAAREQEVAQLAEEAAAAQRDLISAYARRMAERYRVEVEQQGMAWLRGLHLAIQAARQSGAGGAQLCEYMVNGWDVNVFRSDEQRFVGVGKAPGVFTWLDPVATVIEQIKAAAAAAE